MIVFGYEMAQKRRFLTEVEGGGAIAIDRREHSTGLQQHRDHVGEPGGSGAMQWSIVAAVRERGHRRRTLAAARLQQQPRAVQPVARAGVVQRQLP